MPEEQAHDPFAGADIVVNTTTSIFMPYAVLFLPLLAAVAILLFTRRHKSLSAGLSVGAIVIAFIMSLYLYFGDDGAPERIRWLTIGTAPGPVFELSIGYVLDQLSKLMLLVVTGVGSLIHIYSWGYMKDDDATPRYFGGLSLFTFSMLGIVLSDNLVMMFIFWELVGVSSYLLIGHWRERPAAADAAKKAFITNRIGDFGFLLGILLVWQQTGSLHFESLKAAGVVTTLAGLLIFCGAVGKSAQFPLHVWLPDAMEGPTPVSALIHAATMVAAGVYMLCRLDFLFTPDALSIIAWTGGITALLAALMAVQQDDIKRILAYSTLSQLGYMVMAVGCGGSDPAMFHLTTHAFFKALLFLGAGSVIVALHHEQDIWKMGGLRDRMPVTWWTFLIATLALCGVPPMSGFFSKDAILETALHTSLPLFLLATGVAVLTAFYMTRLVYVAFLGGHRSTAAKKAAESPNVMVVPLLILAIPSVIAGFFGIMPHLGWAMFAGLVAAGAGFMAADTLYRKAKTDPLPSRIGEASRWMRNRFYFDEVYEILNRSTQEALARAADFVDRWILAGLGVKGAAGLTHVSGSLLRLLQTGNVQTYALLLVLGVLALLWMFLF